MEKSRKRKRNGSFKRLLISVLFTIWSVSFYAQQNLNNENSYNQKDFSFALPDGKKLYQNEDIPFEVVLEQIKPDEIEFVSYDCPQGINLRLLKKQEIFSPKGTHITLWLSFDSSGFYELGNFQLKKKKNGHEEIINVSFPEIMINKDLSLESSKIVVCFEDGTIVTSDNAHGQTVKIKNPENQMIRFSVYAQFSKRVTNFEYEIPKSSIFKQTKKYEYSREQESEVFSDEMIPVADFEWTFLDEKAQDFPLMKMQCVNFQNEQIYLELHDFSVKSEYKVQIEKPQRNSLYENAFNTISSDKEDKKETVFDEKGCIDLAEKLGKRKKQKILIISTLLIILFTVLFVIIIRKSSSKKITSAVYIIFLTLIITFSLFGMVNKKNAVFAGGKIYRIPDEKTEKTEIIQSGTQVKTSEKTKIWCFIHTENSEGWCHKEQLIFY